MSQPVWDLFLRKRFLVKRRQSKQLAYLGKKQCRSDQFASILPPSRPQLCRANCMSYFDKTLVKQPSICAYMQEMICVEAALATTGPVELSPGDNWVGTQVLTTSSLWKLDKLVKATRAVKGLSLPALNAKLWCAETWQVFRCRVHVQLTHRKVGSRADGASLIQ